MMSIGVVQAEELRGQLGNHIPGVMALAAKATGLTTQALQKQMEAGELLTVDFVPKLARAMRSQFVPSMETAGEQTRTMSQELARVGNVLLDMSARVARDTGLLDWTAKILRGITDIGTEALKTRDRLQQMQEREAANQIERATGGRPLDSGLLKKSADELQRLNQQITGAEEHLKKLEAGAISRWGANFASLRKILADLVAEREKLLQTLHDTPNPLLTFNPTAPEAPDMGAFTEHATQLKRMREGWESINREREKYRQSLEGVEDTEEIPKKVLEFWEREFQKFKLKYPAFTLPGGTMTGPSTATPPRAPESMRALFATSGARHGVDPLLLEALAKEESNFNPTVESRLFNKQGERIPGALGVMQLMPDTAKLMGVKDPFNIQENIEGGAKYFAQVLQGVGGDIALALAAYNASPEAVKNAGNTIPPFKETRAFVPKVLSTFAAYRGAAPSPTMATEAQAQVPPTMMTGSQDPVADSLKEEIAAYERRNAVIKVGLIAEEQRQNAIARIVDQLNTQTTVEDAALRQTELLRIAEQAATGV